MLFEEKKLTHLYWNFVFVSDLSQQIIFRWLKEPDFVIYMQKYKIKNKKDWRNLT